MPTYVLNDTANTDLLRRECDANKWPWFEEGDYNLNLFGIRGRALESNLFDDVIGCGFSVDGRRELHLWPGTTDPGRTYLLQPMRPEGTGILCDGYYPNLWDIGRIHASSPDGYETLVQVGTARVWRDDNRDAVLDLVGPTTTDAQGVDLHHAGVDSPLVNNWSALCQVLKRLSDWQRCMEYVHNQRRAHPKWKYSYKLFDIRKSPRLEPLILAV